MACKTVCRLCDRLILSQAVTFADDILTVNIPAGSYARGEKYCIVIAQAIPAETTIAATVEITIGDGTETYPLTYCGGAPVLASALRTRTRYATRVNTTSTGGSFSLVGPICPAFAAPNALPAIDGGAPAGGGA